MAAYTILQFPIMILSSGVFYLVFMFIAGQFIDMQNLLMSVFPNTISQQTVDTVMFSLGILTASPALILIAIGVWSIVKTVTETV